MTDDLNWLFDEQPELETADNLDRPRLHERREAQRRFVNGLKKEALTRLVPTLPPPNSDVYIVSNGAGAEKKWKPGGVDNEAFDFGTFIPHLQDLLSVPGCIGYVSTWTMNRNHALNLIEMLDDGRFSRLTVFTDPYFQRREPAVAATLIDGLQRHGQTYKAFKNHCKIVAIATPDEQRAVTVVSSANLSAQPRCEQYVLTTALDVYQFYRDEFFIEMTNGKQGD